MNIPEPKVFISYSWTDPEHAERILSWAEQLISDGVRVILDRYDLREGHDKYAFMEQMVTEPSVTHVLAFCDRSYKTKADSRSSGVGTESQIISQEVYKKIDQEKFIPIVCEFTDDDKPCLPVFFESRIWINFSSPELVAENWSRLIKRLFGKPVYEKPKLGKPPAYITDSTEQPPNLIAPKLDFFKQQIRAGRPGISGYRSAFLTACIEFADSLRIRNQPDLANLSNQILADVTKLKLARNLIIDWLFIEADVTPDSEFAELLTGFLEELRMLKSRPAEINQYSDAWFEAHGLFVFEVFLYVIATLLKLQKYAILHEIFDANYMISETEGTRNPPFVPFQDFQDYGDQISKALSPEGQRYYSPAAELFRRQADRIDIPFKSVVEADLLCFLMSTLVTGNRWFPQTIYYAGYGQTPAFFAKCARKKYAEKLLIISGSPNLNTLKSSVTNHITSMEEYRGEFRNHSLVSLLNLEHWGTIN